MSNIPTPHIEAGSLDNVAKVVLMPGDPLRAKYIADHFLTDVVAFNTTRNMLGFTGKYKGKLVSVMASGMGIPSIGIYSYELYKYYDVDAIIRIGTCGSYLKKHKLRDLLLVSSSVSESSFAKAFAGTSSRILKPTKVLNNRILKVASKLDLKITEAVTHSSDAFYHLDPDYSLAYANKTGAACVEMESFGLFAVSKYLNKKSATILSVSDSLVEPGSLTASERAESLDQMIRLALETAIIS